MPEFLISKLISFIEPNKFFYTRKLNVFDVTKAQFATLHTVYKQVEWLLRPLHFFFQKKKFNMS